LRQDCVLDGLCYSYSARVSAVAGVRGSVIVYRDSSGDAGCFGQAKHPAARSGSRAKHAIALCIVGTQQLAKRVLYRVARKYGRIVRFDVKDKLRVVKGDVYSARLDVHLIVGARAHAVEACVARQLVEQY
jgi:hypothetical protein